MAVFSILDAVPRRVICEETLLYYTKVGNTAEEIKSSKRGNQAFDIPVHGVMGSLEAMCEVNQYPWERRGCIAVKSSHGA